MMPPEGPNKAEELLQRYAKERRERGGEFSLHPATRRLLQGEVARQFRKPAARGLKWLAWCNWRRGLAFGAAIATVAVVSVVVSITKQNSHRQEFAQTISPRAEKELFLSRAEQLADTKKEVAPQPMDLLAKNDVAGIDAYAVEARTLNAPASARVSGAGAAKPQTAPERLMLFADVGSNVVSTNTFDYSLSLAVAQNSPMPPSPQSPAPVTTRPQLAEVQLGTRLLAPTAPPIVKGASENVQFEQFGAVVANSTQVANTPLGLNDDSNLRKQAFTPAQNQAVASPQARAPLLNESQAGFSNPQESRRNLPRFGETSASAPTQEKLSRGDLPALAGASQNAQESMPQRYYRLSSGEDPLAQRSVAGGAVATKAESQDTAGKVLAEFTVEQQGNTMRLRDADGSVYEGKVSAVADVRLQSDSETRTERDKDAVVREKLGETKEKSVTQGDDLSFTVAGSNITSRQLVTVRGRFAPATNGVVVPGGAAFGRRLGEPAESPARQRGMSNTGADAPVMIDGVLRVGTSREQRFRAIPVQK